MASFIFQSFPKYPNKCQAISCACHFGGHGSPSTASRGWEPALHCRVAQPSVGGGFATSGSWPQAQALARRRGRCLLTGGSPSSSGLAHGGRRRLRSVLVRTDCRNRLSDHDRVSAWCSAVGSGRCRRRWSFRTSRQQRRNAPAFTKPFGRAKVVREWGADPRRWNRRCGAIETAPRRPRHRPAAGGRSRRRRP